MSKEKVVYQSVPGTEKHAIPTIYEAPKGFGTRHMQAFILLLCMTTAFTLRAHLSVTLVAMIDHPDHEVSCYSAVDNITLNDNSTIVGNATEVNKVICNNVNGSASSWSVYRTYDWKKSVQEMINFSFYAGYTSMMIPMGLVAQKIGGKIPIMIALGVNGVVSILTPWMALLGGWVSVCLCRVLQGMTQACLYPSIHTILGKWAPLSERGRLSTYIYTGSQLGTVISFQLSGFLAGSPVLGWPSAFWLSGVASLICCGVLSRFGAATPHEHPRISEEELAYITGELGSKGPPKTRKTPWRHIFTCPAIWGLVATHIGSVMGFLVVLTQTPIYMNRILGVDIKRNGIYSSLPYIAMYFMSLTFGYVSDLLATKKIMSIVNIRRTANTIGMMVCACFLLGFSFVNSVPVALVLLILSIGVHSGVHVGFHINQIDLAPNFAGPIMAIGNMIAYLLSLTIPILVSNIIKDDLGNQQKWQTVFIIITAIMSLTNLIFVIFAKGEVQPWNFCNEDEIGDEMTVLKESKKEKNEVCKMY